MESANVSFTVLYKVRTRMSAGRSTDENVYTFTCSAVNEEDAVRQLRLSRMYHVTVRDMRSKSEVKFHKSFRVKGFKVVRVYHGDGIHRCTCDYCKTHPEMAPAIRVIPSKQPRWMMKNHFGKGR